METLTRLGGIDRLAQLIEKQQLERMKKDGLTYPGHEQNAKVTVKPGAKYTKVDIGSSGAYMVDADGNIFGIKAYGVIHRGHQFGTLETINEWYWGDYRAYKL